MPTQATPSQNRSPAVQYKTFPRATGFLADIIAAQKANILNSEEAAEWLLEAATSKPKLELHTAVVNHSQVRTNSLDRDDESRILYQWMVRTKAVRADTARQYVARIQNLRSRGMLSGSIQETMKLIADARQRWPNQDQCVAALSLLEEFQNGRSEVS